MVCIWSSAFPGEDSQCDGYVLGGVGDLWEFRSRYK